VSDRVIQTAARILREGGVVCHATEGVWGFACDPFDEAAVLRVLALKQRSVDRGLIVIGTSAEDFAGQLQQLPSTRRATVTASWPGRHTWVLPNVGYPEWVTGGRETLACRVPDHPQARSLVKAFGAPLISTSANQSGMAAATTEEAVLRWPGRLVDYVLPGATAGADGASVIHDLDGTVLRAS
jgi:L-threonylcarbamoyladenylate synthase